MKRGRERVYLYPLSLVFSINSTIHQYSRQDKHRLERMYSGLVLLNITQDKHRLERIYSVLVLFYITQD